MTEKIRTKKLNDGQLDRLYNLEVHYNNSTSIGKFLDLLVPEEEITLIRFIENELQLQTQEYIDELPSKKTLDGVDEGSFLWNTRNAYNQALDDVIQLLKSKLGE